MTDSLQQSARRPRQNRTNPSSRSLIAVVVLLVGLGLYAMVTTTIADYLPDHWAVVAIYAFIAGLLWVWPAIALFKWASAGRRS